MKQYINHEENDKASTWTVTVELTVFAGDMNKENVISNAKSILEDMTDGSDFASFSIIDAKRDVV